MRCIVQKVISSKVEVNGKIIGAIEKGLNVLDGFKENDTEEQLNKMVKKILHLRIFADEAGKMNKNVLEIQGEILLISQFTLYGDTKNGNRPSYVEAMSSERARPLYEEMVKRMSEFIKVERGEFGAGMQVEIHNDGPTTIILDDAN